MAERFYVDDVQRWEKAVSDIRIGSGIQAPRYKDACLLPPVEDDSSKPENKIVDALYRGGISTREGTFIAGRLRSDDVRKPGNLSCSGAYDIDSAQVTYRDETAVFAGMLYRHFGHMITDGFARLWYLADHHDFDRIVFFECPFEFASSFDPFVFLDLLGLDSSRVEIIRKPAVFRELIVPDEAFRPFGTVFPEFARPFDAIKHNLPKGAFEKVYLSRRAFQEHERSNPAATSFIFNEGFYEQFYARRGFEVVYPERLSLEEQVSVIAGAREIVATMGTMTHLLMFADPSAHATILSRANLVRAQLRIDAARAIEPTYIEAASNPLPVVHARGPFLMMPNRHFRRYLDDAEIAYSDDELDMEEELPALVFAFLREWVRIYGSGGRGGLIGKRTMFDVIRQMGEAVNDDPGCADDYRGADRLRTENAELRRANKALEKEIAELKRKAEEEGSPQKEPSQKAMRSPLSALKRHLR